MMSKANPPCVRCKIVGSDMVGSLLDSDVFWCRNFNVMEALGALAQVGGVVVWFDCLASRSLNAEPPNSLVVTESKSDNKPTPDIATSTQGGPVYSCFGNSCPTCLWRFENHANSENSKNAVPLQAASFYLQKTSNAIEWTIWNWGCMIDHHFWRF